MYTVYECIMSNIVQFKLYFYNRFIWIVLYEPVCQPYLHRENKQDGKTAWWFFFWAMGGCFAKMQYLMLIPETKTGESLIGIGWATTKKDYTESYIR